VLRCVLPPEEVYDVCKDGENGAIGWARCIGAPVADCAGDWWCSEPEQRGWQFAAPSWKSR
jgi:hypothetical protein